MIHRSNKLIIFAVIAVIIVAVPITFVELNTSRLPPITVNSEMANATYTYRTNFSNQFGSWDQQCMKAFATISEKGYPNSTFSFILLTASQWIATGRNTQINNYLYIQGALALHILADVPCRVIFNVLVGKWNAIFPFGQENRTI